MTYLDTTPTNHREEPSADVPGAATDIRVETPSENAAEHALENSPENPVETLLSDIDLVSKEMPATCAADPIGGSPKGLPAALTAIVSLVLTIISVYGRAFMIPGERRTHASLMGESRIMMQLCGLMAALPPQVMTGRVLRFSMRLYRFAQARQKYMEAAMAAHKARHDKRAKIYKAYLAWRISVIRHRAFMAALSQSMSAVGLLSRSANHPDALIPP